MADQQPSASEIDKFITDEIESVPHLEALLLLWRDRPRRWSLEEMAKALYIGTASATNIIQDLVNRGLAVETTESSPHYQFKNGDNDKLVEMLEQTYRRDLIRISRLIHSKASTPVRDFARAFRFTKDKE